MNLQLKAKSLAPTRAGFIVLLVLDLIEKVREWMNESIRMQETVSITITKSHTYRFLSALLLSHCTGFSYVNTIELLRNFGATAPSLERMRFISSNIVAFAPTSRGKDGTLGWNGQRDQTRQPSEFELLSFRTTQKIFSVHLNFF